MEIYQKGLSGGLTAAAAADAVIRSVASHVCAALDEVLALPPILPRELSPAVYDWLAIMPGFEAGLREGALLHREKVAKGLL
jgi:hypothetical protein